jgi:hypothetical protein
MKKTISPKRKPFPDWHIWNIKQATAIFLIPRLQALKEMTKQGKTYSIPVWIERDITIDNLSEKELIKIWISYLEEMIDAFKLVSGEDIPGFTSKELEHKKKRGLKLFFTFYEDLWD